MAAAGVISFAVIGIGDTVIDFGGSTFAYSVLGLPPVPSDVFAWLIAASGCYAMNATITEMRISLGYIM